MKLYSEDLIKNITKLLNNESVKGIVNAALAGAIMYAGKEMLNVNFEKKQERNSRPVTKEEFLSKIDYMAKTAGGTSSSYYKFEEAKKIVNYIRTLRNAPGDWYEEASKKIGEIADQCDSFYYKGQITDLLRKF